MRIRANNSGDEPKTLLSRFGFQDGDLKTPQHDEMILWLDGRIDDVLADLDPPTPLTSRELVRQTRDIATAYTERITETEQASADALRYAADERRQAEEYARRAAAGQTGSYGVDYGRWATDATRRSEQSETKRISLHEVLATLRREHAELAAGRCQQPPAGPRTRATNRVWEYAVRSGNYTIGFVDMLVDYTTHRLGWAWENPTGVAWRWESVKKTIAFEVKSTIPSLGELVRQIRMYEPHVARGVDFVVVCPDDRFAEPLAGQGIRFVVYPGPDKTPREPADRWMESRIAEGEQP